VELAPEGGAGSDPDYASINPQGLVPTLLMDGMRSFTQSMSIIEYLDDVYPEPRLLPVDDRDRARVRSMAQVIACDIHPLNTLRVTRYLGDRLGVGGEQVDAWKAYWMEQGFAAIEACVAGHPATGTFCQGDSITMADVFLVPQVYLALQAEIDMSAFPEVHRIYEECMWRDAFQEALPDKD